jgi:hypothetical protein
MKRILASLLLLSAFATLASNVMADVTFTVDQAHTWSGHMNVFDNPLDGGAYLWGSGWGVPDLVSIFDNNADTLTLSPNTIGDPNEYWYECTGTGTAPNCGSPGATGNKIMDANTYVVLPDNTYGGQTITFQGTVLSNSLSGPHVAKAFIRDFAPDYGSYNESAVVLTPGPFSISLPIDPATGRHAQFGFNFNGPNVWVTDVAPFGNVVVQTIAAAGTPGDFDGDSDVDGRDFLIWQRDTNVGSLADWQANYGTGTGSLAAVSSVPEPASLSLIAGLASLFVIRRNR